MPNPEDDPAKERFTDDLAPTQAAAAATYASTAVGPTRQAPLSDRSGQLGWVWTDDRAAAGWRPAVETPAAVRAGAYVWRVLSSAYRQGKAASQVLDPAPYAPLYQLGEPEDG